MKKKITVMSIFLFLVIAINCKVNAFTLVIDPGHGGSDPGAQSMNGTWEYQYTMKISKYLQEYLSKYEMNTYLTHEGSGMEILDRALYARSKKADLVVSIHLNALAKGNSGSGAEVWVTRSTVCPQYQKKTSELGENILENFLKLGISSRGVKICSPRSDVTDVYSDGTRADYYGIICYSLRGCKIDDGEIKPAGAIPAKIENGEGVPAIIIEHCFCRGSDFQFINSDEKLKKLAEADGKAIVDTYNLKLKESLINVDGIWYYTKGGVIDRTATTLVKYNGNWYYVQNGELKWGVRTLVKYNGTWYYINNSTLDWNFTGLFEYNGTQYFVQKGEIKWGINGLTLINDTWYYLNNSALQKNYTGLVQYNKKWYYVQNGKLEWGIKTLVEHEGTTYYVSNSTLDWNYTGIFEYNNELRYIQGGVFRKGANGPTNVNGNWYYLKNGVVQKKNFPDVNSSDWFDKSVDYVYNRGLMGGYSSGEKEGYFGPGDAITRGQIVAIIYRKEGQPTVSGSLDFIDKDDVELWSASYYNNAIIWASQNGIVTGYKDGEDSGKFLPDKSITREELTMILQRYARLNGIPVSDISSLEEFYDYDLVSEWAKSGVEWAVAKGIITGDKVTTPPSLNPQGNATRAEAATMIMRFCKNIE